MAFLMCYNNILIYLMRMWRQVASKINITGMKFNRLTAIAETNERYDKKVVWEFLCDCGNTIKCTAKSVKSGNTKSCGCYRRDFSAIYAESNGARIQKKCKKCDLDFWVKKSHFDRASYCSKACQGESYSILMLSDSNPNWKGGISSLKEHVNERARLWRSKNKDKARAYNRSLRLNRKKVTGSHSLSDVMEIYKKQKGLCAYCLCSVGDSYHIDHIIPISKGGDNTKYNICISCPSCNLRKGSNMPHEWASRIGKLI